MSYYDDYDDDDDDDEYSSEDEIFYHNYSVDYANQILGGHHAISSCLPLMRRRQQRHQRQSPQLVRVSTWDQMPIANRQQLLPSKHSRPTYGDHQEIAYPPAPTRLPSLEVTSAELERRAAGTQSSAQETSNRGPLPTGNIPSSQNSNRPMTEAELMQVQQQQEAFQQHLLNMQRHLVEQTQQQQNDEEREEREEGEEEQQVPASSSRRFERRTEVSYHDLERDDDQDEIAELIENDPYFAAAMEDFAHTHGLLDSPRQRTHSSHSSSRHSQHLCKRHRAQYSGDHYRPSYSSSSSSSTSSSVSNVTAELTGSKADAILFRELHGIRRLMEEYIRSRGQMNQPTISIMPVPWPMTGGPYPTSNGVHYPPVAPVGDYQPSVVPRERVPPPEPRQLIYQNVVNSMKEVIDRRSPSQREEPLKPSQIDSKLKHVYTKRPRIPSSNIQPTSMQRPPLPPQQQRRRSSQITTPPLSQQQQQRRRSSQITTPPMMTSSSSRNIPVAPPYETLAQFSSSRSTSNKNRNLSYGSRQRQSNIYDTLLPGHYLRLYNKYN